MTYKEATEMSKGFRLNEKPAMIGNFIVKERKTLKRENYDYEIHFFLCEAPNLETWIIYSLQDRYYWCYDKLIESSLNESISTYYNKWFFREVVDGWEEALKNDWNEF